VADRDLIPHNRWDLIDVPAIGERVETPRVTVVVPYYQTTDEHRQILERTLAGLARQTYPSDRYEVIVVDDGSDDPLVITDNHLGLDIKVLRQHRDGFGAPRARNLGAANATGEVLLFLDADMIPEQTWVEAHARWHAACAYAVTLGPRWHVDATGIEPSVIADERLAASGVSGVLGTDDAGVPGADESPGLTGSHADSPMADPANELMDGVAHQRSAPPSGLAAVFQGREATRPAWIDEHLVRTDHLTSADHDLFRVVASGNLGVSASLFAAVGGFDEGFDQWGGEDTELGYRLFVAGGLIVHDEDAACWHQGDGQEPDAGERISLVEQRPKMGQSIAHHGFRRIRRGRTYRIPRVVVTVRATHVDAGAALSSIESVLASSVTDLLIHVEPPADPQHRQWLQRQFAHDARVAFDAEAVPWAAPYRMRLDAPAVVGMETVDRVLERLTEVSEPIGVLYATVPPAAPAEARFVAWSARSVNRFRLHDGEVATLKVPADEGLSGQAAAHAIADDDGMAGHGAGDPGGEVPPGHTTSEAPMVGRWAMAGQDEGFPGASRATVLAEPVADDDGLLSRVADVFGRQWVSGSDFIIGEASTVDPLTDEAAAATAVAVRGELQALGEVLARLDPVQQRQLVEVARTGLTQLGPRQLKLLMSAGTRTLRLLTRRKRRRRR